PAERLVRRLGEGAYSGVRVGVPGASWVWPIRLDGIQRGDDVMVYAVMKSGSDRDMVRVSLSGSVELDTDVPLTSPGTPGVRPLVERAWARAAIASMDAELASLAPEQFERAARLHHEILDLSTRYRVLSDHTALLVLETEAD